MPEQSLPLEFLGVRVFITRSAGSDGAVVVFVDTEFEPDGSDNGPGLRINVNDAPVYEGTEYGEVLDPNPGVLEDFDEDPGEPCPTCGHEIQRDDEGDWVHVLRGLEVVVGDDLPPGHAGRAFGLTVEHLFDDVLFFAEAHPDCGMNYPHYH